ncbi:MICU2 protein, partial [Psilopogon haemacephalus]|nr:MICU2 protein [Psilopogon haemacephalus]
QNQKAMLLIPYCWCISLEKKERKNFTTLSFSGIFFFGNANLFLPPLLWSNTVINLTSHRTDSEKQQPKKGRNALFVNFTVLTWEFRKLKVVFSLHYLHILSSCFLFVTLADIKKLFYKYATVFSLTALTQCLVYIPGLCCPLLPLQFDLLFLDLERFLQVVHQDCFCWPVCLACADCWAGHREQSLPELQGQKLHLKPEEWFAVFMENLQTEVQEMEFIRFSKGLNVMRKEDFAEWLLYFTDEENNEIYWQNVKDRIQAGENISLEEFKTFCKFTNNLEDFSIAMQMFTVANLPVKRAEFKRAVKVATGQELSDNVLDTVFKIFDLDGDDCLSHGEFLGVLRNRIHRGLRVPQQQGIQGYWKCVKRESIKGAKEVWKQTGKSPF